ncbi:MAG: lysophospholipid acyltransferase family protein, partial [Verrucomicrobiales bacterium]|nr:lysophospholipid acyltransferase family protein [Verrucomicrobiales bacterium]
MKGALRHPLRCASRALWLGAELLWATLTWWERRLCGPLSMGDRATWLQRHARRVLQALHVRLRVEGPAPAPGFLVANHLSYLDVLVLAAVAPCVFVAKREVRNWPVFGWFAR